MTEENQQPSELPCRFGKYLLVDRIAFGGMAEIFRAKSYGVSGFEKTIVIKRILPSYAEDQEFIDMMIDEAKICASLQHANIVQIFDLGRLEGRYFIAMEYVNGLDLVQVLSRLRKAKKRLPPELACFIMSEALKGLDYAHRATAPDGRPLDIIHRDFNPSNILLSFQGEVKVADFGIAKATDRGTKTMTGGLKGKMGYLSPEQVEGSEQLDARSDVFTAGISFWEMLATRRMFVSGSDLDILIAIRDGALPGIQEQVPDIPDGLIGILSRALARDPKSRYRSAVEFKDAIDDFLFDHGIKISATHLEAYLKHLFADKLERIRQERITAVTPIDVTRQQPPRYWVRKPGEAPTGPLEMNEVSEMIQAGDIVQTSEVLREGGTWRPVNEVPELAPQLTHLPSPEESDPDALASYQGLLAEVSFPKLFYRMAIAKEDGRLVLTRPGIKKEIYLRKGMPEFVKSNLTSERLGDYLVASKVITAKQRDEAVKVMKGYSGRLGDTLIGLGILQPHELFEKLAEQVREKILEVFSWTAGTYRFFAGQTYAGEVIPLKVGSFALVAEGVRQFSSVDMLKNRFRSRLEQRPVRIDNPYLGPDKLGLLAREQRVVDLIDSKATMRDLLVMGGSDRGDFERAVYRVIYILEELEMVQLSS
jgi:serine/threonine-protein kinase